MNKQSRDWLVEIGHSKVIQALLFDSNDNLIGVCIDTPNAIAKAFMECREAQSAYGYIGSSVREEYASRMNDKNNYASGLILKKDSDAA